VALIVFYRIVVYVKIHQISDKYKFFSQKSYILISIRPYSLIPSILKNEVFQNTGNLA